MARIRVLAGDMTVIAGSALYSEEFAIRLVLAGHKVDVICLRANDRLKSYCEVYELGRSPWRSAPLAWRIAYQLDELHAFRRVRELERSRLDLVVGLEHMLLRPHFKFYHDTPWVYVPLSLVAPLELRYELRGLASKFGQRKFHSIQRWALRNANVTARFSRLSCELLESHYGRACARRFEIARMPIDFPCAISKSDSMGCINLLAVGRLVDSKNLDLCIRTLAGLKAYKWRLDIVGEGPQLSKLRNMVVSYDLQTRIQCHGKVSRTDEFYRRANLFLFTSKLDNCPLVVLESMSYGVPVLAIRPDGITYITGVEEMISNGVDGFLAEGEADFRNTLASIFEKPTILRPLGDAARTRVESSHSWLQHVMFFEELLESCRESARAELVTAY